MSAGGGEYYMHSDGLREQPDRLASPDGVLSEKGAFDPNAQVLGMGKKSLVKNSIFNMAYKGFTALFPLATTTYISRVLLPEGVGKVAYANTIVAYFVLIASLGLPSYGVKAIAQNDVDKEQRSRTFFELFFINLIATVLCIIAYFLFVNHFAHFADRRALFNVMGLMLILNIFNIDWFYQGMEEYSYIVTRSVIVKILSFVLMLVFVKDSGDYLIYALILCVATAGNNLLNAVQLRKYITVSVLFRNGNSAVDERGRAAEGLHLGHHMRPVLILLASTIATEVYTMLDTVMLEYFHGDIYVGYYSNAVKIVRMTYTVVIALVAVFYPRISMYYKQGNREACNALLSRGTQILLLLALPCALGLALTAEHVVPLLFKEAFLPSVRTLRILSILVLIFSVAYFLGHIVLTATGMERMILRACIVGAVLNTVVNLLLIPGMKQDGAAIASVLSETAVTVVLLWYARRYYRLTITGNYVFSVTAALAGMAAAVLALLRWITKDWMVLPVIAAAAVVYFCILLLFRNELMMELVHKLVRK